MNRSLILSALLLVACGGADTGTETTADGATLALPNQAEPEDGVLTGGQPTETDLRAAAAAGYQTVISLRTPDEDGFEDEQALVTELGMSFESIPVAGADGITAENAAQLDALLSSAASPMIVHCASSNRVGGLFALRAFAAGHGLEDSIVIGRSAGLTGLEGAVRERLTALCEADAERDC